MAMLWTLFILIGCFMPAPNVPKVDVPLADKWVHFTFFAGFTFFWLCAHPSLRASRLLTVLIIGIAFGSLIEVFQGLLPVLGRASEFMDAVADSIGALLGTILFFVSAAIAAKRSRA